METRFVLRGPSGEITLVATTMQRDDNGASLPNQEELPDDHAEVVAFQNRPLPARTTAQKLAAIGLTIPELRGALAAPNGGGK